MVYANNMAENKIQNTSPMGLVFCKIAANLDTETLGLRKVENSNIHRKCCRSNSEVLGFHVDKSKISCL